jgi:hypothetical protein
MQQDRSFRDTGRGVIGLDISPERLAAIRGGAVDLLPAEPRSGAAAAGAPVVVPPRSPARSRAPAGGEAA